MQRFTLLQRTVMAYSSIGGLLFVILLASKNIYYEYINLTNALVFFTHAIILMYFSFQTKEKLHTYLLISIVFVYSLTYTFSYLAIVENYTGFKYAWNSPDSYTYLHNAEKIRTMPWRAALKYLGTTRYLYDMSDWGGVLFPALIFKIDHSLTLYTFIIICFGTINALLVYKIGCHLMRDHYAFIASLGFALSSYNIYFYGCFMKETMFDFFVLLSILCFLKYLNNSNVIYMALAVVVSLMIYFYRPAIIAILWAAYFSYYVLSESRDYKTWFMILIFAIVFMVIFADIVIQANKYTNNGELTSTGNYKDTSAFGFITSAMGALFGPFPTLIQLKPQLNYLCVLGSGVLFKFLMFFAHWKGFVYALRTRNAKLLFLFVFSILEMFALIIVNDGLEFRKAFPHIPLFILCAFWFLDEYDKDVNDEIALSPYYKRTSKQFLVTCFIVFFASLAWNTIRDKATNSQDNRFSQNEKSAENLLCYTQSFNSEIKTIQLI